MRKGIELTCTFTFNVEQSAAIDTAIDYVLASAPKCKIPFLDALRSAKEAMLKQDPALALVNAFTRRQS